MLAQDQQSAYDRHRANEATEDDLIEMATHEADQAMRSLPPHCLPTINGLIPSQDHANASDHRCWSFLRELRACRVSSRGARSPSCERCGA